MLVIALHEYAMCRNQEGAEEATFALNWGVQLECKLVLPRIHAVHAGGLWVAKFS